MRLEKWRRGSARKILRLAQKRFFEPCLTISYIEPALTPEQTMSIKPIFSSFQLVPYRPTDDEVVHLKLLGDKDLVDLSRSNPLIVI